LATAITADAIDEAVISGCEAGATYEIVSTSVNQTGTMTDTTFEFSTDTPGEYSIVIEAFPTTEAVFTVTAT
jgi:hypothetical protein